MYRYFLTCSPPVLRGAPVCFELNSCSHGSISLFTQVSFALLHHYSLLASLIDIKNQQSGPSKCIFRPPAILTESIVWSRSKIVEGGAHKMELVLLFLNHYANVAIT